MSRGRGVVSPQQRRGKFDELAKTWTFENRGASSLATPAVK